MLYEFEVELAGESAPTEPFVNQLISLWHFCQLTQLCKLQVTNFVFVPGAMRESPVAPMRESPATCMRESRI